eukprot:GGOE01019449.1.p1 GENE.GGOE01019449.1~~GGOE01019449.1.p1  ORF type:complete len:394 (+),score=146.66 GGOE01019449.1:35-1183(+)
MSRAIYVAATKQYIGKTTTCCAILSGLRQHYPRVGYMKPVGQIDAEVIGEDGQTLKVDKDVRLFREFFDLKHCSYHDMSPILIRRGYTKRFLNGQIEAAQQLADIKDAFARLQAVNDYVVLEGTGHCGVGSIIGLDNAWVAKQLGLEMVLICSGGLGSAFDELALNHLKCEEHGVRIRGVIMNRVAADKHDQTVHYIRKALQRWDVPLIGCVPYYTYFPTLRDLEALFKGVALSGQDQSDRVFESIELAATSLPEFRKVVHLPKFQETLWILHATRIDLLEAVLEHIRDVTARGGHWGGGLILAGATQHAGLPSKDIEAKIGSIISGSNVPTLRVVDGITQTMGRIKDYLEGANLNLSADDHTRPNAAIKHITSHLDFSKLL